MRCRLFEGRLCKSQNEITESAPRTTFLVDGTYTGNDQYEVYYYGTNTSAGAKKVVIANNQTQVAFNNTKHFGVAGDCGVAKAVRNTDPGKSGFKFDLQHKASYLCFLPYIPSQQDRTNYRIRRIEITSNNNIAGAYDLSQGGLSGAGNSKTITLNVGTDGNGLALANPSTATTSITNSLYVVIAPGEHKLSVKYTVFSVKENKELTLTKNYPSHPFAVNLICDIPVSLGSVDLNGGHANAGGSDILPDLYGGHNYYMWDAKENYWSGHEWNAAAPQQPTTHNATSQGYRSGFHGGEGAFEASVNPLFKKLPNANEMGWYASMGDAHWDNSTQWTAFGTTYTGGVWLKKLSVIAQENGKALADLKKAVPDGTNLLTTSNEFYYYPTKSGKPADSEIDKYFFLPALGYYKQDKFWNLGVEGCYWSSSTYPVTSFVDESYYLSFSNGRISVVVYYRSLGCVAQPFE